MIERCCKYILLLWTMSFCAHEVWGRPAVHPPAPQPDDPPLRAGQGGLRLDRHRQRTLPLQRTILLLLPERTGRPGVAPRQPGVRHSQRRKRHAVDRHLRRGLHLRCAARQFPEAARHGGAEQGGVQRGIRRLLRPRRDDALRRQRAVCSSRSGIRPGTAPRCSKPI